MKKKRILLILATVVLICVFFIIVVLLKQKKEYKIDQEYRHLSEFTNNYTIFLATSYEEYIKFKEQTEPTHFINSLVHTEEELKEAFGRGKKFIFFTVSVDACREDIYFDKTEIMGTTLKLYLHESISCGVCALERETYLYEVEGDLTNIEKVEPYMYSSSSMNCDMNVAYKPILYFYPTEEMDITVTFSNPSPLTHTYPKYNDSWNIHVFPSGTIYDYGTKRNYYALYWEGIDDTKIDTSVGFVVKGSETIPFLEEKLAYLGLSEREMNEFIIYWINKLENNPYNYIYFRMNEELESYMKLSFSKEPDTLIRIMMDYMPLSEKREVKEQVLEPKRREGFTIVEWGGRKIQD